MSKDFNGIFNEEQFENFNNALKFCKKISNYRKFVNLFGKQGLPNEFIRTMYNIWIPYKRASIFKQGFFNVLGQFQEYKNNKRNVDNLLALHCIIIDVDIWDNERCKSIQEMNERVEILKKWWILLRFKVKTGWWYHLYIKTERLDYIEHTEFIDYFYRFFIFFLLWDINYKRRIWLGKIPYFMDYNNPNLSEVILEEENQYNPYSLEFLENFYNNVSSDVIDEFKTFLIKNKSKIKISFQENENNIEKSLDIISDDRKGSELVCEELSEYEIFKNKINSLDSIFIIDTLWTKRKLNKLVENNSVVIYFDKEKWVHRLRDYSWEKSWQIINSNMRLIYNFFNKDFKKVVKFAKEKLWIQYNQSDFSIVLNLEIIYNILLWELLVDEKMLNKKISYFKEKCKEKYDKITNNWKIFEINDKMKNKVIYLLLTLYNINNDWVIEWLKLNVIYEQNLSLYKDEYKEDLLKNIDTFSNNEDIRITEIYLSVMECLYVKINENMRGFTKWKKDEFQFYEVENYFYLISEKKEIWKNTFDLKLLDWISKIKTFKSKDIWYVPKIFLLYKPKYIRLLLTFLISKIEKGSEVRSYKFEDIFGLIERTYDKKHKKEMRSILRNEYLNMIKNYYEDFSDIAYTENRLRILRNIEVNEEKKTENL